MKVTLFTTCLVDQVYPEIGMAVVQLLERAGFDVFVPKDQVCCGQPFYNSGYYKQAVQMAVQTIEVLQDAEAVVIPSGSCTAMIRHEYPKMFSNDPNMKAAADELADRTFELTEFLDRFGESTKWLEIKRNQEVTYHDSCHMCRTLGVTEQPRRLLKAAGYVINEMEESDRCCGFGGIFFARMPEISQAMVEKKLKFASETGAELVVTADPGCLMRMRLDQSGKIKIRHIAELLSGEGQ